MSVIQLVSFCFFVELLLAITRACIVCICARCFLFPIGTRWGLIDWLISQQFPVALLANDLLDCTAACTGAFFASRARRTLSCRRRLRRQRHVSVCACVRVRMCAVCIKVILAYARVCTHKLKFTDFLIELGRKKYNIQTKKRAKKIMPANSSVSIW